MAGFDSTKRNATYAEWEEQLISLLEINGYNPSFCDIGVGTTAEQAYHSGVAVDDFFYDNYEVGE